MSSCLDVFCGKVLDEVYENWCKANSFSNNKMNIFKYKNELQSLISFTSLQIRNQLIKGK